MRILIVTQHFVPEITAGRFRLEPFAAALAARGHQVEVVCPVPNHPQGEIELGYRGRPVVRRTVGGSRVTYVWIATAREKTPSARVAAYGSFAALASAAGVARRRVDVVLASSPPLSVAAVGVVLAARHRAPLVLDVRDLWPDAAVTLGELAPGRVLKAAERLERWAYAKADRIVTTNEAFRETIEQRAPATARIDVVANGTTEAWIRAGSSEVERPAVGLPEDRFVWAYAGNIGLAHGLEHAADAAALLGNEYLLLVIGEGPRRKALLERVQQTSGPYVDMRALMSPAQAARHLRAADAVLVSERQEATVSAKLYDACAIGRPIVAACRGELRRVIEREQIALAVEHGDAEALAAAVSRLRLEPELRERLSERARAFAALNVRERQAEQMAEITESAASR